mgnify:CR=1 FL=1
MKYLPNVNQVVEQARKVARESALEKVAAEKPITFSVPVAEGLHALAESLKFASENDVTFEDVLAYGDSLLKR